MSHDPPMRFLSTISHVSAKFPLRVKGKTNGRVILLTQMSIDRLAGPRKPIEEGVLIEVPAPKNVADLIRVRP